MGKYIVMGLGNPDEYTKTRHNIGKDIVEKLKSKFSLEDWSKKGNIRFSNGEYKNTLFVFLVSDGYMNESGVNAKFFFKNDSDLILIHDDLDIESGKIKVSLGKSSGGHKGVEDVIRVFGSKDFIRIRIGIGRDKFSIKKYVLGKLDKNSTKSIDKIYKEKIVNFIKILVDKNLQEAIKHSNTN